MITVRSHEFWIFIPLDLRYVCVNSIESMESHLKDFFKIAIRVCFQADDDWLSFVDLGDARRGRDF